MGKNAHESLRLDRRQILGGAAASAVAPSATNLLLPRQAAAMPGSSIRPFHFKATDAELSDLHRRVAVTRGPERETVGDTTQGVQLATMQKVAKYWASDYDWRKIEARMNALPHFFTAIDGIDIQFIHVKSKHANALPVIITHGWPGSIIEQIKVIEPLTNPTAHGGTAADAFDVVIPSLPGHGFSGKVPAPGWTVVRVARAWAALMQRLGYTRYVAQGGDHGNAVSEIMALQKPAGLIGIHTNMAATVPPDISKRLTAHEPAPAGFGPEEQRAWDQLDDFFKNGVGYAIEMNTRPQSLSPEKRPVMTAAAHVRQREKLLCTGKTHVTGGREHGVARSSDGALDLRFSPPGSGLPGTNPEPMLAAGCRPVSRARSGSPRGSCRSRSLSSRRSMPRSTSISARPVTSCGRASMSACPGSIVRPPSSWSMKPIGPAPIRRRSRRASTSP